MIRGESAIGRSESEMLGGDRAESAMKWKQKRSKIKEM